MWAKTSAAVIALASPVAAATCQTDNFEDQTYAICEVAAGEDLRLWLTSVDGRPMGTFDRLKDVVEANGNRLVFAMNAGMYHPDRSPVGLYIEDRAERHRIVTAGSKGNFGMRPNGVFCVSDDGFAVIESRQFAERPVNCRHATQSGPMLVISGELHPRFLPDSTSRYIRNGVGVSPDGQTAWFAISDRPVTFHTFARLFRDHIGTPDALFLDGSISRLYAPELGRDDIGFPMGPMIGVVEPQK